MIGGGAVGLCIARSLLNRGSDVIVLERDVCGAAASQGNAGWITPGLSEPLAAPGAAAQALLWMLRRDSPFRVQPRLLLGIAPWLWRFWRSSRQGTFEDGLATLVELNSRTFALFEELEQDLDFEMHSDGLLFVARDRARLNAFDDVLAEMDRLGYSGSIERVDGDALAEIEPALVGGLAGAIRLCGERHVRPEDFVSRLAAELRARGGTIREHAEVRLESRQGQVVCRVDEDEEPAEVVIIAAGAWCAKLLGDLDLELPLQAAKGYSLTLEPGAIVPRLPLYLAEERLGVSPFRDHIRIAGTLELTGIDLRLDSRRIAALRVAAHRYLRPEVIREGGKPWTGLRPLLPDTIPAIGPISAFRNLYLATGHGTLGITLAPVTGELIADAVLTGGSNGNRRIGPDRIIQRRAKT